MKAIPRNSKGLSLVVVLIMMMILLSMVGAGLLFSGLNFMLLGNDRNSKLAFNIAEAGVHHVWQELAGSNSASNFDAVMNAPGAIYLFTDYSFGNGTYTAEAVKVTGTGQSRVKVTITGCYPGPCSSPPANNAKAVIEAVFVREAASIDYGVITGGDCTISGNPKLKGTKGGAHANSDMQVSGNPAVQMVNGLNASGAAGGELPPGMDVSGNPCVGDPTCVDTTGGNEPAAVVLDTNPEKNTYEAANCCLGLRPIPTVKPGPYGQKIAALGSGGAVPAYILNDNGTVTQGGSCGTNDGLCSGGTTVAIPSGLSFSGDVWVFDGTPVNGLFYSEGKIQVGGNMGDPTTQWEATLIARDSIQVSGNPHMRPYGTSNPDLQNLLFLTGNDFEVSGNPILDYGTGNVILAHQQISWSGNGRYKGFMIAEDGVNSWPGDPFPSSSAGPSSITEFPGNLELSFSGEVGCSGPACAGTIKLKSWRQVL